MKVYVYPLAGDGIDNIATQPEPVELLEVGQHIESFLGRYKHQGYFFNANMQRVPLREIKFRLEIVGADGQPPDLPVKDLLTPAERAAWDKWHSLDSA